MLLWRRRLALLASGPDIRREIAAHVAQFTPARAGLGIRHILPLQVSFHLGGCWGGRISSALFVNLNFYQQGHEIHLEDLTGAFAHELFHLVVRAVQPPDLPLAAIPLWQIQNEGIAQLCGYSCRGTHLPEDTAVEWWREEIKLLDEIAQAAGDERGLHRHMERGLAANGPYGNLGYAIATLIDRRMGRAALREAVAAGPSGFFSRAIALASADAALSLPGPDATQMMQEVPPWP